MPLMSASSPFPSPQPAVFMTKWYSPPVRRSVFAETRCDVPGPNHCMRFSGFVHASKTRSRGDLMKRVSLSVMSLGAAVVLIGFLVPCFWFLVYSFFTGWLDLLLL